VPVRANGGCNQELTAALRAGNAREVQALLARHAKVTCKEPVFDADRVRPWTTPLELAVASGQAELVRSVISAGANAADHEVEVPAVYRAVRLKRADLLAVLLNAGASPNSHSGHPLLREAIQQGDPNVVGLLLDRGADANRPWWSEYQPNPHFPGQQCLVTPLMEAAARGHATTVTLLLAAGADRDHKDCEGETAYDYSVKYKHDNVAVLLTR
jgi:ankyrin repeat protein